MVISLRTAYHEVKDQLCREIEEGAFEARELLAAVYGVSSSDVYLGREIEAVPEQTQQLQELIRRRLAHEPLQYLLGEWDFYGRTFSVGEGVLIPRADTEPLAETALNFLKTRKNPRVLDICTGSGCLAVTIGAERPDAEVWAIEKSEEAWQYFSRNNQRYGGRVRGILADALENIPELPENFDLILSNPPYLTGEEMNTLQPEVAKEPEMALDGGKDGLFFYRELTGIYQSRLKPGGMLAYEIGMGQQEEVSEILRKYRLNNICQTPDFHGIIRVVTAENKNSE